MDFLKEWEEKLAIKITCSQARPLRALWGIVLWQSTPSPAGFVCTCAAKSNRQKRDAQ